jgi:predicted amidohydrolase YtcJ
MMVDLIVENGRIHTGDPEAPVVDTVAAINGRIIAAGNDVDGLQARERVDAHDRVVLPGFNDAHAHSVWFAMTLLETDLSGVGSLGDLYRIIGDHARDVGADEWIVASGFNPVLLHGAVPDRDVLDRVSGGRPVWIKHASGHSCQLNGEGLRRTAVLEHLGDELYGGRIVLDQTGRPTGVLEERAMSFVRDVLLPYPLEVIEQALDLATARYAREGLTSVTDAGVAGGWIGHAPGELAAYQSAREHGVLRTRMQVMPVIDALAGIAVHAGEPARLGLGAGVRTGWGDDWLQLGPVKVFTDGSILGRTAQLSKHYEGCPGYHGYLQEDEESLRRRVLDSYAAGWSLALHAVGDAALDLALDVIEEGVTRYGIRRVRIGWSTARSCARTRSPGSEAAARRATLCPVTTFFTIIKGARSAPRAGGATSPREGTTWQGSLTTCGVAWRADAVRPQETAGWCGRSALAPSAHGGRPPGGSLGHRPAPAGHRHVPPGALPRAGPSSRAPRS